MFLRPESHEKSGGLVGQAFYGGSLKVQIITLTHGFELKHQLRSASHVKG